MIELCKINRLKVVRDTPQGLYLEEVSQKPEEAEVDGSGGVRAVRGTQESKDTHFPKEERKTSAARFTGKREDVLLPRGEVPEHIKTGDEMDVFIYLDSSDRYTATLKTPLIYIGGIACLKIVQVTDIGVFLDWGLEKNLLLPFKEIVTPFYYDPVGGSGQHSTSPSTGPSTSSGQRSGHRSGNGIGHRSERDILEDGNKYPSTGSSTGPSTSSGQRSGHCSGRSSGNGIGRSSGRSSENRKGVERLSNEEAEWLEEGRELPVALYIDKTGRPAATMRVYDRLNVGEKYVTDSAVEATVIQINPGLGVFVAVDDKYFGMINIKEITDTVNVGDRIFGRVSGVREDGKYMISLTQKAHLQMDNDAQVIIKRLRSAGGVLPLGDKSDPKEIMKELGMSKKAFKRAVGQLYKEGKVTPAAEELRMTGVL